MALTTLGLVALGLGACTTTGQGPTRAAIEKLPASCQDLSVAIYFERDSAEVTREAQAVLRGAADMGRGCAVESVRVVGLADAVGAPGANQVLSEQRAKATTEALAAVGFTTPRFEVAAVGDAAATNDRGEVAPLRRRADVVIDLR